MRRQCNQIRDTTHKKKEKTGNIIELNTRQQEQITKNGYRYWIQRWKYFKNWLLWILSFFGRWVVLLNSKPMETEISEINSDRKKSEENP